MTRTRTRTRTRTVTAAVLLAALFGLTGCTVPLAGITGVSVTSEGKPVGVILMCHDQVDAAVLYTQDGKEPEDDSETGFWDSGEPVTGFTSWPLTDPAGGNGWTPEAPPLPLEPGQEYTLYGATHDNSWSTVSRTFTLAELKGLTPDQVSYEYGDTVRTMSLADFRAHACEGF